jgi:hypothetical protein
MSHLVNEPIWLLMAKGIVDLLGPPSLTNQIMTR